MKRITQPQLILTEIYFEKANNFAHQLSSRKIATETFLVQENIDSGSTAKCG